MANDEQVLVVERRIFDGEGLFQGISFDVGRYLPLIFAPGAARFMQRGRAETDPAFKQIIPYVVIQSQGQVLSYVRGKAGGEKRLVGNRSIGIGGHINPGDDMPLFGDLHEAYRAAVQREVEEEIVLESPHTDRMVALLNDDSTEVGRVHLGIVHSWKLEAPRVSKREQMITQLGFFPVNEIRSKRGELESWSQFCIDHFDQISGRT